MFLVFFAGLIYEDLVIVTVLAKLEKGRNLAAGLATLHNSLGRMGGLDTFTDTAILRFEAEEGQELSSRISHTT